MAEPLNDDVLCTKGLTVLEEHLGAVEGLRFLALISHKRFDYQQWRRQYFGDMSLVEIMSQAKGTSAEPPQENP